VRSSRRGQGNDAMWRPNSYHSADTVFRFSLGGGT